MPTFTLSQATELVDGALSKARELGLNPMTVAVLDAGGHLLCLKREDGSSLLRPQIAQAKAWGSLGMGVGGRSLAARAATHPSFVAALGDLSGGQVVPVPGGILVQSMQGEVLGAIGVTGDLSDQDEACALAAIESAGFTGVI